MEIYLEDSNGDTICFNHAVKAVIANDENIKILGLDESNCGQSGAWQIGGCKKCNKENGDKYGY